ncbi:MAG: LEA type 2 family protein [Bdellovibrionales bacterium]|nr:LEA type 2 family protein [Bdellovibrionales bacterium]
MEYRQYLGRVWSIFRPRTHRSWSQVVLLLAVVCSGCSPLQAPQVTVEQYWLRELPFAHHAAATFRLNVVNDNWMPLSFSGATHTVELGGNAIGTAVDSSPLVVPARSTAATIVFVYVRNNLTLAKLERMAAEDHLTYHLQSKLFSYDPPLAPLELGRRGTLEVLHARNKLKVRGTGAPAPELHRVHTPSVCVANCKSLPLYPPAFRGNYELYAAE